MRNNVRSVDDGGNGVSLTEAGEGLFQFKFKIQKF